MFHFFIVIIIFSFLVLGSVNFVICFQSSLSDKFKRPFKKRHSSLPHAPSNRVNKYLAQAIEARSVDREKSTHVSLFTLCFRDREKERHVSYWILFWNKILKESINCEDILVCLFLCKMGLLLLFTCRILMFWSLLFLIISSLQYHEEQDVGFGSSLLCSLFLLLFVASIQALVLPRTLLFLFLFLAAFVTISVILIVLLASRWGFPLLKYVNLKTCANLWSIGVTKS